MNLLAAVRTGDDNVSLAGRYTADRAAVLAGEIFMFAVFVPGNESPSGIFQRPHTE